MIHNPETQEERDLEKQEQRNRNCQKIVNGLKGIGKCAVGVFAFIKLTKPAIKVLTPEIKRALPHVIKIITK